MEEFSPLEYLNRLMRYWWIALITTLLGGGLAILIIKLQPPIYQATAGFIITLDRAQAEGLLLNEYDVDLAYATIHTGLAIGPVVDDVIASAREAGISLDHKSFEENMVVDRRIERWQIHFRSSDPIVAQTVVNLWAERAFAEITRRQEIGEIADYIHYEPPDLADIPTAPLRFSGTHRTLAGAIIGLVFGMFLIKIIAQKPGLSTGHKPA